MTVLRAACAFSLAFFVFFQRESEEPSGLDVLLLTVAVTFHYSAIVFFAIYFLKGLNPDKDCNTIFVVFLACYMSKNFVLSVMPEYFVVFETHQIVGLNATVLPAIPC